MLGRSLFIGAALLLIGAGAEAGSSNVVVPEAVLRRFQVGAAPDGVQQSVLPGPSAALPMEQTATLDGTQYAVIAPIFTGADGNVSFIRLSNLLFALPPGASVSTTTATFNISVVGVPSGAVYGKATYTINKDISRQVAITDLLIAAGVSGFQNGDTGYALYLAQGDALAKYEGYQHVIYSGLSTFFENASLCAYARDGAGALQQVLPNVHTSALPTYPSQLFIHNYQNAAVPYQVYVVEASSGFPVGVVTLTTAANASYLIPESFLEQQVNFNPTSTQQYVNLFVFNRPSLGVYNPVNAVVGHYIYNQSLTAYVNMSVGCAMTGN